MADRYWVGGAGTWDSSNTANWAATSGGTGGETVPTLSDNVYFDANSGTSSDTISVFYSECGNLNTTGFPGSLDTYVYLYGNATFDAANNSLASFSIYCAGIACTINSGGKTISTIQVANASAVDISADLTVDQLALGSGSFTTNNYNVTVISYFYSITDSAFTLNLGSSTVTFTGYGLDLSNPSLTISAGTSTLAISGSNCSSIAFGATSPTWYDITVQVGNAYTSKTFYGGFTCNNLTLYKDSGVNVQTYFFTDSFTVNGTFTANGDAYRRINLGSWFGRTVTINAAAISLSYVNFFRMSGGGAATWSGTSFGDIAYNSGITFDAPKTVYFNYPTGGYVIQNGVPKFATTSGGATAAANNPLPQDTIIFENTGLNTSAMIRFPYWFCLPNTDFSGRTNAFNFYTDDMCITRSLTMPTAATITASGAVRVFTNSSQTFNANSKTITFSLEVYGYLSMGAAYTSTAFSGIYLYYNSTLSSNYAITLTGGRLDTADPYFESYHLASNYPSTIRIGTSPITAAYIGLKSNALQAISTFPVPAMIVTGNNGTVFDPGVNGTSDMSPCTVNFTYAGGTGTRTIANYCNPFSINVTAGTDTVIAPVVCTSLNFTGFSGNVNLTNYIYGNVVYGDLTLSSGLTVIAGSGGLLTIGGNSSLTGTNTFTTFNKTLNSRLTIASYGTLQLNGDLTTGANKEIEHERGTFTTNGYNVTCSYYKSTYTTPTRTLNLGSSVVTLTSTGTVWNIGAANYTLNAGTSEIVLSSTSTTARTFAGGGKTYNKLTIGGATGVSTTTISGSNTFNTLASTKLVAHTISLTSGTTQTIATWSANGTAGNLVTLTATGGTNATVASSTAGPQIANYMSISKSTATPGSTWYAVNSTDGGGNTGWTFGAPVSGNGLFFGSNF